MALDAGTRLTASLLNNLFGVVEEDIENTLANITALTYSETLVTSNTPAATTFVAPSSGKVLISNNSYLDHSTTGRTWMSFIIREGGVIGSGTVFTVASDANAISNLGTDDSSHGKLVPISGLTAEDTYNVRQAAKVTSITGETQFRSIIVIPVIA